MTLNGENRLTELDRKLIALLQVDAHRPNTEFARELGVAESTVRRRIEALIQREYLQIVGLTDPFKLGFAVWIVIEIDVDLPRLESVATMLARMSEVTFVAVTAGATDILLNAMFRSNEDVYEFISKKLAKIPGIRKTAVSNILRVTKRTPAYSASAHGARQQSGRQARRVGSGRTSP